MLIFPFIRNPSHVLFFTRQEALLTIISEKDNEHCLAGTPSASKEKTQEEVMALKSGKKGVEAIASVKSSRWGLLPWPWASCFNRVVGWVLSLGLITLCFACHLCSKAGETRYRRKIVRYVWLFSCFPVFDHVPFRLVVLHSAVSFLCIHIFSPMTPLSALFLPVDFVWLLTKCLEGT